MATKTTRTLTDDIDGSAADTTLTYNWEGQAYEIDLNDKNAEEFREAIAPYVAASRKAGPAQTQPRRRTRAAAEPGAASDVDPKDVRAWAKEQGIEVSTRGRINSRVLEQYKAAH